MLGTGLSCREFIVEGSLITAWGVYQGDIGTRLGVTPGAQLLTVFVVVGVGMLSREAVCRRFKIGREQ